MGQHQCAGGLAGARLGAQLDKLVRARETLSGCLAIVFGRARAQILLAIVCVFNFRLGRAPLAVMARLRAPIVSQGPPTC